MKAKNLSAKGAFALLKETYAEFSKDKCMRLGAALAYYSLFSIAPLILVAVGIVGMIYGPQAAQGQVAQQLSNVMGPQMAETVEQLVASADQGAGAATFTGIVILLVGASGVFAQLKESLNTIWEVKPKEGLGIWGFIRGRLLAFGMVLVIGFLMLTSLILTAVIAAFNQYIEQAIGIPAFVSGTLAFLVPFAVEVLLFAMIFKILPDAKIPWKTVWVGAAVTAFLFEIGKALLSWYFATFGGTNISGAMGSVVLLLLWVYYSSLILFFGAEFTEVWSRAKGMVIEPADNAEKVTPEERVDEGLEPEVVPNPSPAAAMAGRDPYTGQGSKVSSTHEQHERRGPVRVEPSLLSDKDHTPSQPRKERIAPLIASRELDYDEAEERERSYVAQRGDGREMRESGTAQNPMVELGAALGLGLVMGIISRFKERDGERQDNLTPGEHLRLGAKAALIAGAATLARVGPTIRKRAESRNIKRTIQRTADQLRNLGEELPRKVDRC